MFRSLTSSPLGIQLTIFKNKLLIEKEDENIKQIIDVIDNLFDLESAFNMQKSFLIAEIAKSEQAVQLLEDSLGQVQSSKKKKGKKSESAKAPEEIDRLTKDILAEKTKQDNIKKKFECGLVELKKQLMAEVNDLDQTELSRQLVDVIESYQPLPLTFNPIPSKGFDILENHIASNTQVSEGFYTRSQNKSIWHKYKIEKLESKFQYLVNNLINKNKSENIGANIIRLNSLYLFKSSGKLNVSSQSAHKPELELKDDILKHKFKIVKMLVNNMKKVKLNCLRINKNQLDAKYPCFMVQFVHPPREKNKEILSGYAEFVTHLMIAKINAILKARGLEPLIERRQSFGFLTPTLTDTNTALRLSLGLTPNTNWVEAVQDGIIACDKILSQLKFKARDVKKDDKSYVCLDQYTGGAFQGYAYKLLEEITGGYTIRFVEAHELDAIIQRGIVENEIVAVLNEKGFIYATNKTIEPVCISHKIVNSEYGTSPSEDTFFHRVIINEAAKNKHFPSWDECLEDSHHLMEDINLLQLTKTSNRDKSKSEKVLMPQTCEVVKVDSIPQDLKSYRGKYLFHYTEGKPCLYFVYRNQEIKLIDIKNPEFFEDKIIKPFKFNKNGHTESIVFSAAAINILTGKVHPEKEIANIELNIDPNDEIVSEYKELYERSDAILSTLASVWVRHHDHSNHDELSNTKKLVNKSNQIGTDFLTKPRDFVTYDTSDDEDPFVENHEESKKNYRTPWGMAALFAPMMALREVLPENEKNYPLSYACMPYSYFEIQLNWNSTLLHTHFTQSKCVKRNLIHHVIRDFLNEFQHHSFMSEIDHDVLNQEVYKAFMTKYINQWCDLKNKNINYAKREEKNISDLLAIMKSTISSSVDRLDAEKFLHKIDCFIQQSISNYCQHIPLEDYLNYTTHAKVVHIDANPCVTKNKKAVKATDAIKRLCKYADPAPLVLVLDITSATQDHIQEIIKEFDKQDKIPLLVTAMSGLKNSQLGLDCFPYGENKIYRSKACLQRDPNLDALCDTFSDHLKAITQGSELGISRVFRRELTATACMAKNKK